MQKIKKIAITGPESTGKSQLTEELAKIHDTVWVKEYAREYLKKINREYNYNDILIISEGQFKNENSLAKKAKNYLFCDTDFTVTKIWSEFKYGKCHKWINEMFLSNRYDLYLLCDIDLPWTYDPLREHPNNREELFEIYKNTLINAGFKFEIINGIGKIRLENALKAIRKHFVLIT